VVVAATVVDGARDVDVALVEFSSLEPQPERLAVEINNPRTVKEIVDRNRTLFSLAGG